MRQGSPQPASDLKADGLRFALVVSRFNDFVTTRLRDAAIEALVAAGASRDDIVVHEVPGSFEIPQAARRVAEVGKVDAVVCLSVNDAWVMKAWAEQHDALGKIVMLADGSGAFTKALGIELDLAVHGMGSRARRGVIVIEDGTVKSVEMEAPGKFEVSSADACLIGLKK